MRAFLFAVLAGTILPVGAADWPARAIHLVVPYAPGGPVDVSARLLAVPLQNALGQPVVVDNKPGAGGNIGADAVAKSTPDGHTLVMGAIATHAINPTLYRNFPYDPIRDFRHVALVVQVPNVLVVNNDVPARDVRELIVFLKKNPSSFASGSTGSTGHLAGVLFQQLTGVEMVHVPYKGSAPAVLDLIAGRVQLMFDNLASALPNIKAGKVRALAVTTAKRSSFVPELPTIEGFDLATWWGVMAPAKTPDAVAERLSREILAAIDEPGVKEKLRAMGSEAPGVRSPTEFTRFVERELKVYSELVKRSGATAD